MGARNRVGIGLPYRPAKLYSLAVFIKFVCVGRVPDPTSHFPPDLILFVNLVARQPKRFKTCVQ
jgi:hypothetical protein